MRIETKRWHIPGATRGDRTWRVESERNPCEYIAYEQSWSGGSIIHGLIGRPSLADSIELLQAMIDALKEDLQAQKELKEIYG
jgi:hypothetical protein